MSDNDTTAADEVSADDATARSLELHDALEAIDSRPLAERAEAFSALHDRLGAALEAEDR